METKLQRMQAEPLDTDFFFSLDKDDARYSKLWDPPYVWPPRPSELDQTKLARPAPIGA